MSRRPDVTARTKQGQEDAVGQQVGQESLGDLADEREERGDEER